MRKWLHKEMLAAIERKAESGSFDGGIRQDPIYRWFNLDTMEPFEESAEDAARRFVKAFAWPDEKPPAMISIDDRAITFTGEWPDIEDFTALQDVE